MNRQQIIDHYKKWFEIHEADELYHEDEQSIDWAEALLKEITNDELRNDQWISVEYRLPEKGTLCLFHGKLKKFSKLNSAFPSTTYSGCYDSVKMDSKAMFLTLGKKARDVTHWQPLPPKP